MNADVNLAYRKRLAFECVVLFLLFAVLFSRNSSAQAPPFLVQHNGVTQFSANALQHDAQSPIWNFCDTPIQCGQITPPPNDPGAYTSLPVTWYTHGGQVTRVTDVTQFGNVFGHVDPTLPVQPWPFTQATVKITDQTPKYLRLRIAIPLNPGTLPHWLKAVSYGKSPPTIRGKFAVVPVGAPWPVGADTACWKHDQPFSDQRVITIMPAIPPPQPNPSYCYATPGSVVDMLIDLNANGTGAYQWL